MDWKLIKNQDEWCDYEPDVYNRLEGYSAQRVLPEFPFLVASTFKVMELGVWEHFFVSVKDAESLLDYALKVELFEENQE